MRIRLFTKWWLMTLKGILAIALGLVVLIIPRLSTFTITSYFGYLFFLSGGLIVISAIMHVRLNPRWIWWFFEGSFDLVIAVFITLKPLWATAFFLILMALYAFYLGIVQIVTSIHLRSELENWWHLLISGFLSIVLAILIFFNTFGQYFSVVTIAGCIAILLGIIMIFLSRKLREIYL